MLHMRPFSLHVDFKQNLSLALTQTNRQRKALTAKNIHETDRDGRERQIKEVRTREWREEEDRQGVAEGFSLEDLL